MSVHQFHLRPEGPQAGGLSWQQTIDAAGSEQAVVKVVRDFVASLNPCELGRLPAQCRPGKFFDAGDIASFAFEVARHHCEDDEVTRHVAKIAAFFSHANMRLAQLLAQDHAPEREERQSA